MAYSCILIHPEHRKSLRFWWNNTVPVSIAPVRFGVRTKWTTTTSRCILETDGNQTTDLFGRFHPAKSIQDRHGEGQVHCSETTHRRWNSWDELPTPSRRLLNIRETSLCANKQLHMRPDAFAANWHADFDSPSRPAFLQAFTNTENKEDFKQSPELQCHDSGNAKRNYSGDFTTYRNEMGGWLSDSSLS